MSPRHLRVLAFIGLGAFVGSLALLLKLKQKPESKPEPDSEPEQKLEPATAPITSMMVPEPGAIIGGKWRK